MATPEEVEKLQQLLEIESRLASEKRTSPGNVAKGFVKDEMLIPAVRGVAQMPVDIMWQFAQMQTNPLLKLGTAFASGKAQKALDQNLPMPPGDSLFSKAMEGVGQGALLSPGNAVKGGLSAAVGNLGGEATSRWLDGVVPDWMRGIISSLAGTVAGGAAGVGLGWHADKAEPISDKANRDRAIFTKMALDRTYPQEVDPTSVANRTVESANNLERRVERARGNEFKSRLSQVQPFTQSEMSGIVRSLRQQMAMESDLTKKPMYEELITRLQDAGSGRTGKYATDPDYLKGVLASYKKSPLASTASSQQKWSNPEEAARLAGLVESSLGQLRPGFQIANDVFRTMTQSVVNPLKESTIGRIADSEGTRFKADPASARDLNAILQDTNPQEIARTLRFIEHSGPNGGPGPVSPEEIARAILQKKLNAGPKMPAQDVFGAPGSGQERQLAALLLGAGKNPADIEGPLRSADRTTNLEFLGNPLQVYGAVQTGVPPGRFRAFLHPMFFEKMRQTGLHKAEVAELLKSATQAEQRELYRLSQFDPNIRANLALAGALPQALSNLEGQ